MVYDKWKFKVNIILSSSSTAAGAISKIFIPVLPGMDKGCKDIRFSGAGKALPYWIEEMTAAGAGVFVKLPANVTKVFLHYGNGAAVSESNLSQLSYLFWDDIESGSLNSTNWSKKQGALGGMAGAAADSKVIGSYSAAVTQFAGAGEGSGVSDQVHTFIKIAMSSLPVGTTLSVYGKFRRWKDTTDGGDFVGLGFGSTTEIYNLDCDDAWHSIITTITRTDTSTWAIIVYKDGTQVSSGTFTKTFSTYFNFGLQTRGNTGSATSMYGRMDTVLAWIGPAPKLTIGPHYEASQTPAAALNSIGAAPGLRMQAGYSFKDQPISAACSMHAAGEYSDGQITGGVTTIRMTPAAEIHDTKIEIQAGVGIQASASAPLKYYIEVPGSTMTAAGEESADFATIHVNSNMKSAAAAETHDTKIGIQTGLEMRITENPHKYYISEVGDLKAAVTFKRKDYLRINNTLYSSALLGSTKFETLSDYPVVSADVSKTITDAVWQLTTDFIGPNAPTAFYPIHHQAKDHNGVTRHLFTGIVPQIDKEISSTGTKTSVTAFDYGWYLSAQYIPDDARTMEVSSSWWGWGRADWRAWINYLLQGTGITAYRIRVGPEVVWKQFIFSNKTTKREAIDQICEYCGYIFDVKWRDYGTTENPDWRPVAYWVPVSEIDDELDIPSPVSLVWPDPNLVDLPKITTAPEERINRVRIIGSDPDGHFYSRTVETAAVTAGTEYPREYMEESSALTSQAAVNAYASAMLDYFARPAVTVTMKFINRFDLQLYQKIQFGPGFPQELYSLCDGTNGIWWLRIVGIKYHTEPANNYVEVTAVYDHPIHILKKRHHVYWPNFYSEMVDRVKKGIDNQVKSVVGTIESVASDGNTAVLLTEFGNRIRVRLK